jgi:hypothetical protein
MSVAGAINFADIKEYSLYPMNSKYAFSFDGKEQIRGDYHNIYVRLRRDVRAGKENCAC